MDLQNVKNLTIPEGSVKTIHDNGSRLLWGAVGYDTKYVGDTTQQTYKGVNLFNKDAALSNQYLNGSGGWTSGTYSFVNQEYTGVTATQIAVSFTNRYGNAYVRLGEYKSDDTFIQRELITTNTTVTLASGTAKIIISVDNISGTRFEDLQVEYGSTATSYEPYVGGIPAPNPGYPQTVNVVTGAQTITISDGTLSKDFTVDLGPTKLCKIGTYQDYIYKNNGNWYAHKETKIVTLVGDESWNTTPNGFYLSRVASSPLYDVELGDPSYQSFCDHFDFERSGTTWTGRGKCGFSSTGTFWLMHTDTNITNAVQLNAWLSSNNTKVYFPISTPTNTQITDATLMGQLNDVHEWLTRYGYNATVSGDLPIVLQRDSLQ